MGGIAHMMGCCVDWPCPCTSGSAAGFQAVVTVAPPATCHADCYTAARTYNGPNRGVNRAKQGGETTCLYWTQDASELHAVTLVYNRARAKWYAVLVGRKTLTSPQYFFGGNEGSFPGDNENCKDVTAYITCNEETGEISGTFDLDGLAWPGARDCSGCTATVTVSKYW